MTVEDFENLKKNIKEAEQFLNNEVEKWQKQNIFHFQN